MPQNNSVKSYIGEESKMPFFTGDPVKAHPVYIRTRMKAVELLYKNMLP